MLEKTVWIEVAVSGVVGADEIGELLGRWVGYQGGRGNSLLYIPMALWLIGGYTVNSQKRGAFTQYTLHYTTDCGPSLSEDLSNSASTSVAIK